MTRVEDEIMAALRTRKPRHIPQKRAFMDPANFKHLRKSVIKATQVMLAMQLVNPATGDAIATSTLSKYESGQLGIPMWVAKRMKELTSLVERYAAARRAD
jgi:hypothetical protein